MGQFFFQFLQKDEEPPHVPPDLMVMPDRDVFDKLSALRLERHAPADFPHGIDFGGNRGMAFIELNDELLAQIDPSGKSSDLIKKYGKTAAMVTMGGGCNIIDSTNDMNAFARHPEAAFRGITNGPYGRTNRDILFVMGNLTEGLNALYEAGILLPKWRGITGFLNSTGLGAVPEYEIKHGKGSAFRNEPTEDLSKLSVFFRNRYNAVPEVVSNEVRRSKEQIDVLADGR